MTTIRRISARRRPGVITLVWAMRGAGALLIALPVAAAMEATGIGAFPDGDARLFETGGLWLLEALRIGRRAWGPALQAAAVLWCVFALWSLVPLAALLDALARPERLRLGPWLGRSIGHLPTFVALTGATLLTQATIVGAAALLATGVRALLRRTLDAQQLDVVTLAVLGIGVAGALTAGLLQDLARATVVETAAGPLEALRTGWATLRRRCAPTIVDWLVPTIWSLVVLLLAGAAVGQLRVDQPGSWRWIAAAATHQVALFALVFLRATWLAAALRVVARPAATTGATQPTA